MCPGPQAFSTLWEAGTVLDLHCCHQVLASHFHFMAPGCLRGVGDEEEHDCRMPVFKWKFVVVLRGFVRLGLEKLRFPPQK